MAQSDNEERRLDLSLNGGGAAASDKSDQPSRDQPEASQNDGRKWTLRRIEGVIGSIA